MMRFDPGAMRAAAARPEVRAAKERTYQLMELRPGGVVADLGCGPGADTVALALHVGPMGRVVGIDADPVMVAEADAAAALAGVGGWVAHRAGSLLCLPLPTAAFDAARCERVLQHLSPPEGLLAVAEAARVLRPGGVLVLQDTDWPSLSIHSPDPTFERWMTAWITGWWRNGFAARGLAALLASAGIPPAPRETRVLHLTRAELAVLAAPAASRLVTQGLLAPAQWQAWMVDLARAEAAGAFYATVNTVICHGRKVG